MKKYVISSRLAVLVMVLCFLMSGVSVYGASSSVSVSGQTVPKTVTQGSPFYLKGVITAEQKIKRVEIGVIKSGGKKWTSQKYDNKKVNAKSFDIKKADSSIRFGKLRAGTYYYRVYVHTEDNKTHCVINEKFKVEKLKVEPSASVTGYTYPAKLIKGKSFVLKGTVRANAKIQRVDVGVVNKSTGKWTAQKYSKSNLKTKTFNIAKADPHVKFGKLAAGEYYYRIVVKTGGKNLKVLNKAFSVSANTDPSSADEPEQVDVSSKVKCRKCKSPGNYKVGKAFKAKGTVTCSDDIVKVEVGIVVAPTNKWSQYKYTAKVGSKSFNLSDAADSLRFDMLPGGDYRYRMYVHTEKGVVLVFDKKFTVKPSNKPKAAVAWAKKIAADDTYTYGKGYGGYFTCCICKGKTKKKKDAKFTCMPFLAAAYAHGTGNKDLMNNGRHIMNLNDDNFKYTLGENWFKVGLCRDLSIEDLQPGDVIIKWSATNDSGHSWMYGGGDSIIEAVPADIRVLETGASAKLQRYGSYEGTPSKNYVMRYRH